MSKQLYEKIGEEYKPINPIIKLDDIIDRISENSVLSMLLKSNHYYIEYSNSIEATRNKVPLSLRRKGLWISYNNGKEDITECFIGKNNEIAYHWSNNNNWKNLTYIKVEENSITYQHLNDNLKRAISENKEIINFPDDEDLMIEGNVLKLANKEYNPNTFSGLGEVIIRKNIKNINGKNKNIITNDNFDKENTIYVIKYDFDLNDDTINIPKNSVLRYKGGSLNNGKIVYNNTIIEGIERLNNVTTEGDYTYPYIKDRHYSQDFNSSMGYVILRKNKSFAEQVIEVNTIYEIGYDFNLGGEEVEIPENCVLKFEGGNLSNGTIIGNYTIIEASPVHIFDLNTAIEGTWSIEHAYAEWFGAIGDEVHDDRPSIQKAMDSFYNVKLLSKRYLLDSFTYNEPSTNTNVCLVLPPRHTLCGEKMQYSYYKVDLNGNIVYDDNGVPTKTDPTQGAFYRASLVYKKKLKGKAAILSLHPMTTVENVGIGGNVRAIEHDLEYRTTGITIQGHNSYRITLRNVDVWSCYYAVNMACWMSRFEYVMCRYNLYGMVIHGAIYGNIGIWDIYSNPSPNISSVITSCFFNNCYCNGNFLGGYRLLGLTYSSMTSCAADGCGTFNRETMYEWDTDEDGNKLAPPKELQTATYDNIHYAYVFEKCSGMHVSALGGEEDLKGIKTTMCRNITIENSFFYNYYVYYTQKGGSEPYEIKNFISSNGDTNVIYKDIFFNLKEENLSHNFIAAYGIGTNKTLVTFKNMLTPSGPFGIESLDSAGHLTGSIVKIEHIGDNQDYNMASATYPSSAAELVYQFSSSNIRNYLSKYYKSHVSLNPRKLIVDLTNGGYASYVVDGSIIGNNDILHIIGDENSSTKLSVNGGVTFRQFKSVIFENISVIHGSNHLDTLMNFPDGVAVVFINCTFARKSALTLNRFFNSDNISFNKCTNPDTAGSTRTTYTSEEYGRSFFDKTLNKVIWWTGSKWIDAAGADV